MNAIFPRRVVAARRPDDKITSGAVAPVQRASQPLVRVWRRDAATGKLTAHWTPAGKTYVTAISGVGRSRLGRCFRLPRVAAEEPDGRLRAAA